MPLTKGFITHSPQEKEAQHAIGKFQGWLGGRRSKRRAWPGDFFLQFSCEGTGKAEEAGLSKFRTKFE